MVYTTPILWHHSLFQMKECGATLCVVHHETVINSHGDYKSWSGRQNWCNFMSGLIMLAVSWVSIKTLIISDDEWSGGVIKTCFTMAWCFLYELHFVDLVNFLDSAMLCVELMCTFLKALCMCVFCVCSSHGKTTVCVGVLLMEKHPAINGIKCIQWWIAAWKEAARHGRSSLPRKRSKSSRFPLSEQTF